MQGHLQKPAVCAAQENDLLWHGPGVPLTRQSPGIVGLILARRNQVMSEMDHQVTGKGESMCPECAAKAGGTHLEQSVYAIGKLDCRFPTIGVEREFQQRERAYALKEQLPAGRG